MKSYSLLLCLSMVLFGYNSFSQTVTISSGLASDTVCSGTSVTFTATPAPAGTYGYEWKLNGVFVGSSISTYTYTFATSGSNIVSCLLTSVTGDTTYGNSDTLTITVDTLPIISPITGSDSVCIGDSILLSDATAGGTWLSGNTAFATIDASGELTGIALPMGGGGFGGAPTVRVYYTVTNMCGTDSTRARIKINAPAGPIEVPNATICLDSTVFLRDTSTGGAWSSSDTLVASFINLGFGPPLPVLTGNAVGTTTIYYNDTNACGAYSEMATITVINCDTTTAVQTITSIANGCSIYPNPSTGAFNITANSSKYNQANCTVSNLLGEQMKNFTISTNRETAVDLNMPTGVYFITISDGNEKYTSKIIIMQ